MSCSIIVYMPIHDLNRTDVKVKVTLTPKSTQQPTTPKCPHTKFEISTSTDIGDMLKPQFSRIDARGQSQVHSDHKYFASTFGILDSYH